MIEYAVNPHLRLKVQREAGSVTALSLSAPVPGRGLQRNELKRGHHGEDMMSVLCQLRKPEFLRTLPPETGGALMDIGVLIRPGSPPERPSFECAIEAPANPCLSSAFLQLRVRDLVRRQAPASVSSPSIAQNDSSQLLATSATRWVRYMPSDVWLPYAVPAELGSAIDRALDNDAVVAGLGLDGAAALLEPSGVQHALQPALIDLRRAHGAREHCSLSGLIPESWRRAFANYYATLVAQGFWPFDDGQSARYWVHNEPIARILHPQLAPFFAQIVGLELLPSYTYSCWYVAGARLDIHTDRPQCGYTASLLLDSTASAEDVAHWPLGIVDPATREIARYVQAKGEAVLFCGTRYPHFREPQPEGRVSTCVFLHYVTSDFVGPLE